VDWNGDGSLDLIFGERRGNLNLYTGNGDGTLHSVGRVYDDAGNEIKTIYNSSPWLVDWNEDGRLDLLLAGYMVDTVDGGLLRVYPGVGDQADTLLFDADYLDYTSLYNQRRTTAKTCDLDGDGDKDLVMGYETGEVYYSENTGTNEAPRFRSYSVLQCDVGPINVYRQFAGGGRARVDPCDFNSDGVIDLLVGCQNGWIYVFLGYQPDAGTGDSGSGDLALFVSSLSPAGGVPFELTVPTGVEADLTVRDTGGQVVTSIQGLSGPGSFDLSGSIQGIYLVTAQCEGRQVTRRVLIL
jgi:hypothetical protein